MLREMLTPRPLLPHRIANVIAVQLIRDLYARPLPAVRRVAALALAVESNQLEPALGGSGPRDTRWLCSNPKGGSMSLDFHENQC
jgi:hypothetical protein